MILTKRCYHKQYTRIDFMYRNWNCQLKLFSPIAIKIYEHQNSLFTNPISHLHKLKCYHGLPKKIGKIRRITLLANHYHGVLVGSLWICGILINVRFDMEGWVLVVIKSVVRVSGSWIRLARWRIDSEISLSPLPLWSCTTKCNFTF